MCDLVVFLFMCLCYVSSVIAVYSVSWQHCEQNQAGSSSGVRQEVCKKPREDNLLWLTTQSPSHGITNEELMLGIMAGETDGKHKVSATKNWKKPDSTALCILHIGGDTATWIKLIVLKINWLMEKLIYEAKKSCHGHFKIPSLISSWGFLSSPKLDGFSWNLELELWSFY